MLPEIWQRISRFSVCRFPEEPFASSHVPIGQPVAWPARKYSRVATAATGGQTTRELTAEDDGEDEGGDAGSKSCSGRTVALMVSTCVFPECMHALEYVMHSTDRSEHEARSFYTRHRQSVSDRLSRLPGVFLRLFPWKLKHKGM